MPPRRELLLFTLIAVLGVLPAAVQPAAMVGDGVDALGTWWFYGWIADCVTHGMNPSWTERFFFPLGKDIFTHTGNNFVDAVIGVPGWLLGTRGFAVYIVVLLVGNALTFRPLAQLVLGDEQRAFSATLLWMVNPYTLFEITAGRPTQAFLWFVPAVPYFVLKVARGGGWNDAIKLGVSAALVGWTYWFACFFVAAMAGPLVVWEFARSERRLEVAKRLGLALLVACLLVAPAAIPMAQAWAGGETPGGTPEKQSIFALPGAVKNSVGNRLHGLWLMETLGAPLFTNWTWIIPLGGAFLMRIVGRGLAWAWWAGLGVVLLLAVGPVFNNEGNPWINVPYMVVFKYVPFFNRLWFPYRFAAAGMVVVALAIAAVLPTKRGVWLAGALALGSLVEQASNAIYPFAWHDVGPPKIVETISRLGGGAMFMPFGIQHDGIAWIATARIRLFAGMGESAPALWPKGFQKRSSTPVSRALRSASVDDRTIVGVGGGDVQKWSKRDDNPRWLILRRGLQAEQHARNLRTPSPSSAIQRLTSVIGQPPAGVDGELVVWELRGAHAPLSDFTYEEAELWVEEWPNTNQPAWTLALQEKGRFGRPGKDDWQ